MEHGPPESPRQQLECLTSRELVVLRQLRGNATIEEIASELFVSRNTVKSQLRSAYRKIGAGSRQEAVSWADTAGVHDVPVARRR